MRAAMIVAASAIREHSRRRLLFFFVILSAFVTVSMLLFIQQKGASILLLGSRSSVAEVISLGFFSLLALIAAVAVSMGNVGRPFSSGEAAMVLARPVSRRQYVAGRLLSSWLVTWGICLLLAIEAQAVSFAGGGVSSLLWQQWAYEAINLSIVVALATLLSTAISTPIIAAILTFLAYQALTAIESFYQLLVYAQVTGPILSLARAVRAVAPQFLLSDLELKQIRQSLEILPGAANLSIAGPTAATFAIATAYLVGFIALSMALAERKEV